MTHTAEKELNPPIVKIIYDKYRISANKPLQFSYLVKSYLGIKLRKQLITLDGVQLLSPKPSAFSIEIGGMVFIEFFDPHLNYATNEG